MKNIKKITSVALAATMIMGSTLASAAHLDLKVKETGEIKSDIDWLLSDDLYLDVLLGANNKYLIEVNDKFYKSEEVVQIQQDNPGKDIKDLVENLESVDSPVDSELKVESVSAINLNQIKVTFNSAVEKISAENKANYSLDLGNNTLNAKLDNGVWTETPTVKLQADNKSVVITLNTDTTNASQTLLNQVEATLTTSGVRSADGMKTIPNSIDKMTLVDTTIPVVSNVSMEGNKVIVVKFSEPVKGNTVANVANYKINGVSLSSYGVSGVAWDAETATARINLTTGLADGEYTVTTSVNNAIEDYAGLKVIAVDKKVNLVADTTVATVTGVEVASDKSEVIVKFSKPLSPTSFKSGAPLTIDGVDVFGSSATLKAEVENGNLKLTSNGVGTAYNSIIAPGTHAVNYTLDEANNKYLVDAYGIKVGTSATTYSITLDTVKPEVTGVSVKSGNAKTEVKFSELVDSATAQNRFNYTLKKADGTAVTVTSATFKSGSTDTVVLNHGVLDAGSYTLEVQNVKDTANNTMTGYSAPLAVADTIQPTVADVKYSTSTNSIYVYYSENMNGATIENAANYLYEGSALPTGTTVTALSPTTAKITLPSTTPIAAGDDFSVSNNVTDVAGNKLSGFGYNTTLATVLADNLDVATVTNPVKATAKDKIVVTLNKELKSLDAGDLRIERAGGSSFATTVAQQDVSYVNQNGKAIITIDVADMGTDAKDGSNAVKVSVKAAGPYGTLTTDDTTFTTTSLGGHGTGITVADKIAPELDLTGDPITTVDSDNDGQIDAITIDFTENIDNNFISASTFDVSGYNVISAAAASKTVTLTVAPKLVGDTDATPNVTRVGVVKDTAGNEFKGLTTPMASVDKVGPVIMSAVFNDETNTDGAIDDTETMTITFSESVSITAADKTAITSAELDAFLQVDTADTFATAAHTFASGTDVTGSLSADGRTLTINFTDTTSLDIIVGDFIRAKTGVTITDGTNQAPTVTGASAQAIQ